MRSVERTISELLLPAVELAEDRPTTPTPPSSSTGAAGLRAGCTAPVAWSPARPATRASCCSTRARRSGSSRSVHVQALELFLRRAGLRVLLLSAGLAEGRFRSALRALEPSAVVICGSDAGIGVLGPALRTLRNGDGHAPLYGYRAARLVAGRDGLPSLGAEPDEATDALLTALS